MSNYEQIGNQNINSTPKINEMNSSNDIGIKTSKEYHPIEFYSLGGKAIVKSIDFYPIKGSVME